VRDADAFPGSGSAGDNLIGGCRLCGPRLFALAARAGNLAGMLLDQDALAAIISGGQVDTVVVVVSNAFGRLVGKVAIEHIRRLRSS